MPTLHGSWIFAENTCCFFLWGEAWQSQAATEATSHYPYLLNSEELLSCFEINQIYSPSGDWQQQWLTLPSYSVSPNKLLPLVSMGVEVENQELSLQDWQIEGLKLNGSEVIPFFASLPLNSLPHAPTILGDDLKFWCHVYRWSLHLLVRCKFIPGVDLAKASSSWQALLDSIVDQTRLAKLTRFMPPVCTAYADNRHFTSQALLLQAVIKLLNSHLCNWLNSYNAPAKASTLQKWISNLSKPQTEFTLTENELEKINRTITNWTLPLQEYIVKDANYQLDGKQFRLCLGLTPPQDAQEDWELQYHLQALGDPQFLLDAQTIWANPVKEFTYQGRVIRHPQETLLKDLGFAARLYPPILTSLEKQNPTGCFLSGIQVYEFIRGLAAEMENHGLGMILPPGLNLKTSQKRLGVVINASVKASKNQRLDFSSLLNYKLAIAIGDQVISQAEFNRLLANQSPLVEINGEWIALQPRDVKAAQEILEDSGNKNDLSVADAVRLSTGNTKVLAKLPVTKFEATGILQELLDYINNNQSLETIPQPQTFRGQLRPYQLRGLSWLAFLDRWGFGACLADDMGLGKTPQLLAFLLHLQRINSLPKPVLLVCPTSVIGNWVKESEKFAPSLRVMIHHGDRRYQGKELAKQAAKMHLIITSYALVSRDENSLKGISWQGIVLDEAQNIKNSSTKQSQVVRRLQTNWRIALTGTPIENRLSELWSIVDFTNPGWLGNRQFFQRRFGIPIEKYGDNQSLQELRSLTSPFILRRLKTDPDISHDLPEKLEMNVFCPLAAEQAQLYQDLVDQSLAKIAESEGIQRQGAILSLLMKLKQVCNHPAQFLKEKSVKSSQRSGKLLRLEEMLEELIAAGDRALIFTQFSQWGKLLQPYLSKRFGQEVLFLYGATRRLQRQEMIERFQNDPNGPSIFILSLKAGGTGLNLTRANHVFHYDRWWNPAVENQATDRTFRLGQTRNVQVHKFICSGTLEERINVMLESKQELADQAVATGEDWLTQLDTNQLRDLLLLDRQGVI